MEYTKEVMDHFKSPRNVGEMSDADGIGEVGNIKCGDVMHIFIKVGKRPYSAKAPQGKKAEGRGEEEYIEDIKFQTLGCAAAIAASSMMTELAKGKSLDDAEKISRDDINDSLGKLPAPKYHCSILSAEGIKKAIKDYRDKKGNS